MPLEAVPLFRERFEQAVQATITPDQQQPELEVNAVLGLNDITPGFWHILKQFAPFGPGNHSPVFVSKNVVDTGHSRLLKGNHLRISVRQDGTQPVMGIAFGMGEHFARIASKRPFHVAYKIEEEQWQGRSYLRMMVKDFWF